MIKVCQSRVLILKKLNEDFKKVYGDSAFFISLHLLKRNLKTRLRSI